MLTSLFEGLPNAENVAGRIVELPIENDFKKDGIFFWRFGGFQVIILKSFLYYLTKAVFASISYYTPVLTIMRSNLSVNKDGFMN
jgi:hypothetical protein